MAIPTSDFITKPYDDSLMKYRYDLSRYELKLDHAMARTGINLSILWRSDDNAELYLEMISDVVDTYISKFKDPRYYKKMKYYLSHSKQMREAVYELMIDAIRYNQRNGGFMIAYETGINLNEMKELRMQLENAMSVIGDQIANKYELKNRYFKWDFDVVPSVAGSEW